MTPMRSMAMDATLIALLQPRSCGSTARSWAIRMSSTPWRSRLIRVSSPQVPRYQAIRIDGSFNSRRRARPSGPRLMTRRPLKRCTRSLRTLRVYTPLACSGLRTHGTSGSVGRLDLEGGVVWEDEFISGFGPAYATDLSLTPEGDVVVVGISTLEGGGGEIWTRRYGSDGSVQWTEGIPFNGKPSYAIGPALSAGGAQIVVGFQSNPGPEELLVAYAASGGPPLFNLTPAMSLQNIGAVAQAPNGNILVGAYGQLNSQCSSVGWTPRGKWCGLPGAVSPMWSERSR